MLDIVGPTKADIVPNKYIFKYLEYQFNQIMDAWKIEKEQRIKPSLWWSDVVTAQQAQTGSTTEPVLSKLPADGKVWYLHPVGMREFVIDDSLITLEMLITAHPAGSEDYYREILPYLNQYALAYGLTEHKEIAHESAFRSNSEDLYYTEIVMKRTFGCKGGTSKYNRSTDTCELGKLRPKLWTQTDYYARNPERLGNYVYANRYGNGNEASGDGYRYRGRGLIQLTFKAQYNNLTIVHNRNNPNDIQDFVANPDLLMSSIQYAIGAAFVFWFTKTGKPDPAVDRFVKLSDLAKSGNVQEVTQVLNGGQNGYNDRKRRFNRLANLLGLEQEEE